MPKPDIGVTQGIEVSRSTCTGTCSLWTHVHVCVLCRNMYADLFITIIFLIPRVSGQQLLQRPWPLHIFNKNTCTLISWLTNACWTSAVGWSEYFKEGSGVRLVHILCDSPTIQAVWNNYCFNISIHKIRHSSQNKHYSRNRSSNGLCM